MTESNSRDERGRLIKGHTVSAGRPAGRAEGDRIRELVKPHREAIVAALVQALGDPDNRAAGVKAAEALLGYLSARPRPQAAPVRVPGMKEATTLKDKAATVTAAVAEGVIDPDSGAAVIRMLESAAKITEVTDLEARIRALEGKPPRTIDAEPEEPLV